MNRIYISKETNPYFNVASEYRLLSEATDNTDLFLWQNSPSVIFGRNQNILAEANMKYLKEKKIYPVRRFSGGGAVFQDLGNVNFTFITKEKNANPSKYLTVIEKALSTYNIQCEFSGRNDILCDGKKFSGHAYFTDDDNYIYHGTLMVDVNLDILTQVLKPSTLKLNSKGISSVRSRVINLSSVNNSINTENIQERIIESFIQVFGETTLPKIIDRTVFNAPLYSKISKDSWIYDQSPQFSITLEKKLSCGNVSVSLNVIDGLIEQIKIQTDSLTVFNFCECEKHLIKKPFKEDTIFDYIRSFIKL